MRTAHARPYVAWAYIHPYAHARPYLNYTHIHPHAHPWVGLQYMGVRPYAHAQRFIIGMYTLMYTLMYTHTPVGRPILYGRTTICLWSRGRYMPTAVRRAACRLFFCCESFYHASTMVPLLRCYEYSGPCRIAPILISIIVLALLCHIVLLHVSIVVLALLSPLCSYSSAS